MLSQHAGWDHLSHLCTLRKPLFPNLCNLCWVRNKGCSFVPALLPILCPNVVTVEALEGHDFASRDDPAHDRQHRNFLQSLLKSTPNLRSLTTSHRGFKSSSWRAVCRVLPRLTRLEVFQTGEIDASTLVRLSTLPKLRSLRFRYSHSEAVPTFEPESFAKLQMLHIHSTSSLVANFTTQMPSGCLQALDISVRMLEDLGDDTPQMLEAIGAIHSKTLSRISLAWSFSRNIHKFRNLSSITPLYSYPLLEELTLRSTSITFVVYDSDIKAMASAWPLLRSLKIWNDSTCTRVRRPTVTLNSLQTLAVKCPHLHELVLSVDASQPIQLAPALSNHSQPQPQSRPSRLFALDLQESPSGNMKIVSRFLREVFPDLKMLHVWEWKHWLKLGGWKSVFEELKGVEHGLQYDPDLLCYKDTALL